MSLDGQSKQFLTINVISLDSNFPSFGKWSLFHLALILMHTVSNSVFLHTDIRLNSMQYSQLREKIQAPIRVARSVLIQQSLNDRFTVAFTEQVQRNGVYSLPEGSAVSPFHT